MRIAEKAIICSYSLFIATILVLKRFSLILSNPACPSKLLKDIARGQIQTFPMTHESEGVS